MPVIVLLAPICRLNTTDEIVAGRLRLAKMKVMVDARGERKEERKIFHWSQKFGVLKV